MKLLLFIHSAFANSSASLIGAKEPVEAYGGGNPNIFYWFVLAVVLVLVGLYISSPNRKGRKGGRSTRKF